MSSHLDPAGVSSSEWARGSVLAGRYRVEGELGRGGWGVVLAVTDERQRPFALKLLLHDATDQALRRFAREAEVIGALHSRHVCRIHDTGSLEDGSPYIVMDRLVGDDLDAILREEGPMSVTRAVDYLMQACDAIAEAHLNGVVHRDIKPSNLFLARDPGGEAIKVLDFGIAKARRTDLKSLTGTGTVLGSPYYMPPEQLIDSRDVDLRADIWALGVTLFELLTGQPCFHGKDVGELFTAVLRDEPIPLLQLRPDAPGELGSVLARCLQKLPEDRFASVAELASALEPFASESGRTSAQRIRALTFRRSGRGVEGPTALLATPDPVGPTLVQPGLTPSPQPTTVERPPSPPGTLAPSSGSYPAGPAYPGARPIAAPPAPTGRSWSAWIIAGASLGALVVATLVTAAVLRSGAAGDDAGEETEEPARRPTAAGCTGTTCDFGVGDLSSAEPAASLGQLRRLLGPRLDARKPLTFAAQGVRPDGTFDESLGTMSWVLFDSRDILQISVIGERTHVYTTPLRPIPNSADLDDACPMSRVLAETRQRHPEAQVLQVVVSFGQRPPVWLVMPDTRTTQDPWSLTIGEGCVVLASH